MNHFLLRASLALAVLTAVTSCRTIQYREIQSDFQRAVEAETARVESPFVDWYQGVADTLSEGFIGRLDEKLQPNAWMLRGMAEWRSGRYTNASISAEKGWAEIERQQPRAPSLASSRDGILLKMLPGLVLDSKLRDRLKTLGTNRLAHADYQANYRQQFKSVMTQFSEAKENFSAPTPDAVKHYWNYQAWRTLQNWRITLGRLPRLEVTTNHAYDEAQTSSAGLFPGVAGVTNLSTAITAARDAIPADHPYRQLIVFEEKQ